MIRVVIVALINVDHLFCIIDILSFWILMTLFFVRDPSSISKAVLIPIPFHIIIIIILNEKLNEFVSLLIKWPNGESERDTRAQLVLGPTVLFLIPFTK